jgi:DNA modification methylase
MFKLESDQQWNVYHGDVIPCMINEMEPQSIDTCITSVPFPSVYAYTDLTNDLGNSESDGDMKIHFGFFFRALMRVMKPGRCVLIHCMNLPPLGRRKDTYDFRGLLIRIAKRSGFLYDNDWLIWKNPQVEAIRSHAHGLLFVTLERDRVKTRAAMSDYIIKLIAPGKNEAAIDSPGITREDWIDWAAGCWHGIRQTKTLNTKEAKTDKDTKHVCPLQLDTINRLVRLFSNPGEIIFDPFSGIGSTAYESIRLDRRFIGCELKKEYYETSLKNINRAIEKTKEGGSSLLDLIEDKEEERNGSCAVDHDPFAGDLDSDSISELYDGETIDA